ncbi:hypothetical protein ACFX2A_007091 [Malus domestica]
MLDLWLVERLFSRTLLERFLVYPCPTSGYFIWGTLDLSALQKLIHQGCLLCKGARQFYDLSGQFLFAIWIGRTWMECTSLNNEGWLTSSVRFELGNVKSAKKCGENASASMIGLDG